jgi:cell wall-associated NlpC family hydrolase
MGYSQQARQVRESRAAQTPTSSATPTGSVGGSNTYGVPAGVKGSRAKALQIAGSYLGRPYVMGGTSYNGIDCSGLVKVVYSQLGFNVPVHFAAWQRDNIPGVRTNNINSLSPGDIVAWRDGSHIAIYAGNGMIIQAANPRQGVIRSRLTDQVGYTPNSVIGIKLKFPGE